MSLGTLRRGMRWAFSIRGIRLWPLVRGFFYIAETCPDLVRHEFLTIVINDELKDQTLESFVDIFRVISSFRFVQLMSVNP